MQHANDWSRLFGFKTYHAVGVMKQVEIWPPRPVIAPRGLSHHISMQIRWTDLGSVAGDGEAVHLQDLQQWVLSEVKLNSGRKTYLQLWDYAGHY